MDWQIVAVYLFCAAYLVYVGGLLRGLYFEFSRTHPKVDVPADQSNSAVASPAPHKRSGGGV
jgi:hypothetical protein